MNTVQIAAVTVGGTLAGLLALGACGAALSSDPDPEPTSAAAAESLERNAAPTPPPARPTTPTPTPTTPTPTTDLDDVEEAAIAGLALEMAWESMSYSDQQDMCLAYNVAPDWSWRQFGEGEATGLTRAQFDSWFQRVC